MASSQVTSGFGADPEILKQLLDRRRYIDVVLLSGIDNKEIYGHRVILGACSSYLNDIFTTWEQTQSEELILILDELHGVPLKALIDSFYTGYLDINLTNVDGILTAAKVLGVSNAKRACEDFIQRNIYVSTCLQLHSLANKHNIQSLQLSLKDFICDNFMKVYQTQNFLNIERDSLTAVLSSDSLNVDSENDVLEALFKWLTHDERRGKHIADLLNLVRIIDLQPSSFAGHMNLIKRFPEIQMFFNEVTMCQHSREIRSSIAAHRLQPRKPVELNFVTIYTYMNQKPICKYSPSTKTWTEIMKFNENQNEFGACMVNNKELIIAGGASGIQAIAAVVSINLSTKSVKKLNALNTRRASARLVFHGNSIYAVGGCDGKESVSTVERLQQSNGAWTTWQYVASMNMKRSGAPVVVLNEQIYAVGGYAGAISINNSSVTLCSSGTKLSSVERYNPKANEWITCKSMNVARVWHGLGVLNNYLYAVGGISSDRVRLGSVERYDPQEDIWTQVCSLNTGRFIFSCAVLNERLIVAGGEGNSMMDSMEEYNSVLNVWTVTAALPLAGQCQGFVTKSV